MGEEVKTEKPGDKCSAGAGRERMQRERGAKVLTMLEASVAPRAPDGDHSAVAMWDAAVRNVGFTPSAVCRQWSFQQRSDTIAHTFSSGHSDSF